MKIENSGFSLPQSGIDKRINIEKSPSDFQAELDKATKSPEDKPLRDAANQFEAMFLYQMFKQMKSTVEKGGLIEEGMGEQVFQDMLDFEVTNKAVNNSSLGLADMIYKQLKGTADQAALKDKTVTTKK